ncbi:MAG: hypothetical protein R3301_13325 [Saprospiraceae bacterium]|nr:hypothetical protein [Saprospiraceae bacterium]
MSETTHRIADLVRHARSLRRDGDVTAAMTVAQTAVRICPQDDPALLVLVQSCMGQLCRDTGEKQDAIEWYRKAVAHVGPDQQAQRAHLLRHVADILFEQGALDDAWHQYQEVIHHYASEQSLHRANALRGYALVLEGLDQPSAAREAWNAARQLYAQFGIMPGVAECDTHLAQLP